MRLGVFNFISFVLFYHAVETYLRSTKWPFKVTFFLHVFKMLRARAKFTSVADIAAPPLHTSNIENF